ncbi:MAG: NADH-quinone oxidoreductase subunit F, partial [Nitrospirae bacterium]|nr:NADH-quinone oxidoreductase subunit F [Nitrospirota bacterium]
MEKILLKNIENPNSADINEYKKAGGYGVLPKAIGLQPKAIIDGFKKSGLSGRGGAVCPFAMKWSF